MYVCTYHYLVRNPAVHCMQCSSSHSCKRWYQLVRKSTWRHPSPSSFSRI